MRVIGGVELAHAPQHPGVQAQLVVFRGRRREGPVGSSPAPAFWRCLAATRGVEGSWASKQSIVRRERLARARPFDPFDAVAKDPGGEAVLLLAVARVGGQVRGHARLGARAAQDRRKVVVDLALGDPALRLPSQRHLAVDQLDAIELPSKALVHTEQEVRVVCDVAGGPALFAQDLRPHLAVAVHGLPAGLGRKIAVGMPAAEGKRAPAGHDRPAGGNGRHPLGIGPLEAQRLLGHLVHRGRTRPRAVYVVGPEAVHHHNHHVHRVGWGGLAPEAGGLVARVATRRPEQRQAGGAGAPSLNQAATCEVVGHGSREE